MTDPSERELAADAPPRTRELVPDGGDTNEVPDLQGSIRVSHMVNSRTEWDTYGGRHREGNGPIRHMNNTEPPARGWLGNPFEMDGDTEAERRRVIAAFLSDFLARVESDPEFRQAVEGLRGQTVACWCRGTHTDRDPTNWCHLDVVDAWLNRDLSPVHDYLRNSADE